MYVADHAYPFPSTEYHPKQESNPDWQPSLFILDRKINATQISGPQTAFLIFVKTVLLLIVGLSRITLQIYV